MSSLKHHRIVYRWKSTFDSRWNGNFSLVEAKDSQEAVKLFTEEFKPSINFQIISIDGATTNAERQRIYRAKKNEGQHEKELRGIYLTESEEKQLKPIFKKMLEEMRAA